MMNWMEFANERGAMTPCALCETMVPDAVDATLTDAEQLWFNAHVADCTTCASAWADAQRGAAWLSVLHTHSPAVPASLAAGVLSRTTGADAAALVAAETRARAAAAITTPRLMAMPATQPVARPVVVVLPDRSPALAGRPALAAHVLPFLHRRPAHSHAGMPSATAHRAQPAAAYPGLHPRLAMTAAMAFFSLALTANLLGVQPGDLRPGHIGPVMSRTFTSARADVVRQVQSAPLVSRLETTIENANDGERAQ